MKNEIVDEINLKTKKLEEIKVKLKEKFVGIDDVIDKIINTITLWYIMPEIQYRPLIVSLWGITGVGKTDLVRTLVSLLELQDKFVEIQMDTKNEFFSKVENYLENSDISYNEPAVLLLDEIQRFRTIDRNGELLDNKYFNDVWNLLSDGKFQNDSTRKKELMEDLFQEIYWRSQREEENNDNEDEEPQVTTEKKSKKSLYGTSYWTAHRLKKRLKLDMEIEDIMRLKVDERIQLLKKNLERKDINDGNVYNKLLIFVSGNLDEAFTMAFDVEDTDRDADILNNISKKINIVHIKRALTQKFKPEQIARFGNNHIIYPILNKASYRDIITKYTNMVLNNIRKAHSIDIKLDSTVTDAIYRNGVFPTQGVRPVLSTISNILESNLPIFIYQALINDIHDITLKIENDEIYSIIKDERISKKVNVDIDNIKTKKSIDEKMLVAAHEVGHAFIHAMLLRTPPLQISINGTTFGNGFILMDNEVIDNSDSLKKKMIILLGGLSAEEIIFGKDYRSTGSETDILKATQIASNYNRRYGMNKKTSRIEKKEEHFDYQSNYDIEETNIEIEKMVATSKAEAIDLLNNNIDLYKEILKYTISKNNLTPEDIVEIFHRNGVEDIKISDKTDPLIYSYKEKLDSFLNEK